MRNVSCDHLLASCRSVSTVRRHPLPTCLSSVKTAVRPPSTTRGSEPPTAIVPKRRETQSTLCLRAAISVIGSPACDGSRLAEVEDLRPIGLTGTPPREYRACLLARICGASPLSPRPSNSGSLCRMAGKNQLIRVSQRSPKLLVVPIGERFLLAAHLPFESAVGWASRSVGKSRQAHSVECADIRELFRLCRVAANAPFRGRARRFVR